MCEVVEFSSLRADWYANGNFMARAIQRQLRVAAPMFLFRGFPRQWLPMFAWAGAKWESSIEPAHYVPLFSGRAESEIAEDISRARDAGQLRLLVEVAASTEVVLCETLQRIDDGSLVAPGAKDDREIRLTTWHSYSRPDVRAFDLLVSGFQQTRPQVMFIPCANTRPYQAAPAHQRLMKTVREAGLDVMTMDVIVLTSLGPVPENCWGLEVVQRYNTGIRDIYRLYLQTKRLLENTRYVEAWDLMSFVPYSDIVRLLHADGILPTPKRLKSIRRRNIPIYRRHRRKSGHAVL
jgi:hypothetical protein